MSRELRLPRSAAVRARCVESFKLYEEGVPVNVIGAAFNAAESTVYEWVATGRALVALQKDRPDAMESIT